MIWFKFNDILSSDIGLIVKSVGFPTKPKPIFQNIEVPGRNGNLTQFDGTYESYEKKVLFLCKLTKIPYLFEWLRGSGTLIVSNEEEYYYEATIKESIETNYYGSQYVEVEVPFEVQPFKFLQNGKEESILQSPQTQIILKNPTNFDSNPILIIEGVSSDLTITINKQILKIKGATGTIEINSHLKLMMKKMENASQNVEGDFPILIKGDNVIKINGNYQKMKIQPNWRSL